MKKFSSLRRAEVGYIVDRVFVSLDATDTTLKTQTSCDHKQPQIFNNISDSVFLSTFAPFSTNGAGDFKLGVTTSGKSFK